MPVERQLIKVLSQMKKTLRNLTRILAKKQGGPIKPWVASVNALSVTITSMPTGPAGTPFTPQANIACSTTPVLVTYYIVGTPPPPNDFPVAAPSTWTASQQLKYPPVGIPSQLVVRVVASTPGGVAIAADQQTLTGI